MHRHPRGSLRPWFAFSAVLLMVAVVATGLALIMKVPLPPSPSVTGAGIPQAGPLAGARTVVLPPGAPSSKRDFIDRMTIHHTESGAVVGGRRVDARLIGQWHEKRGLNESYHGTQAAAYHFVILPDGTVQAGRPLNARGSGTKNLMDNGRSIGVVLVGDFSSKTNRGRFVPGRPTAAQLHALTGLALWAFSTFHFGPSSVHGHREVGASDCPGDRFDLGALRRRLAAALSKGDHGVKPPIVLVR